MLQKYSDEEVVTIMQQLVAEAILEGRLDNVDDDEIEQAQEIGLSLGFVEHTEDGGLALARAATPADAAGAMKEFSRGAYSKRFGGGGKPIKNAKTLFGAGAGVGAKSASGTVNSAVGAGKKILGKLSGLARKHPLGTLAVGAVGGAVALRGAQKRYPLNGIRR